MSNVLLVIASQGFRDEELLETKKALEAAGNTVKIASTDTKQAKGVLGITVKPDMALESVNIDDFDAIAFIGGPGAKILFNNKTALALVKQCAEQKKICAAICIASCVLANAGVLRGKKATCWASNKYVNILETKGATFTGQPVTHDGKFITANGPIAAYAFGEEIARALKG